MMDGVSAPDLTTKTKRASALPLDERRSMIVAATPPLLIEHGDRVTSPQIAAAPRLAQGTLFPGFGDKGPGIPAAIDFARAQAALDASLCAIPADLPSEHTG